jgi:molybdopterin converting factor subunit 1
VRTIRIRYFASLREAAGKPEETLTTDAASLEDLYLQLAGSYGFGLSPLQVRAARNREMVGMSESFSSGDEVVFMPPVAGG